MRFVWCLPRFPLAWEKGKVVSYRGLPLLWFCLFVGVFSGCIQKKVLPPLPGLSASSQLSTAAALAMASETLRFRELSAKKVFLHVHTLASFLSREQHSEDFLQAWLWELLVRDGVFPVSSPEQAEIELAVQVNVLGIDRFRRDFPPLFYTEYTDGKVDMHLVAYQRGAPPMIRFTKDVRVTVRYREAFWFYFLGPYPSLEILDTLPR
ncbi:MAG: hypothetical protein D6736_07555 [Nitrospinota bacterium]|nr:MAG: hypothetical protein D6736_07555 [Nitrospinota bacterium]